MLWEFVNPSLPGQVRRRGGEEEVRLMPGSQPESETSKLLLSAPFNSLTEGVDEVLPFKRFSFPLTDLKRCVLLALLSA